jgi:hypothetical protein
MFFVSLGSARWPMTLNAKIFLYQGLLDPSLRTPHTVRLFTRRRVQRDCLSEGRGGLLSQDVIILQKGIQVMTWQKLIELPAFGSIKPGNVCCESLKAPYNTILPIDQARC